MDMTQVDLGQGALVSGAGKTTSRGIVDLLIMDHDTGPLVYATTRAGGEGITVHGVANGRFAQVDHVAFTGDDIAGAVTRLVPLELGTASWMAVTGLDDRAGLHGWAIDGAIDGAGHLGSKALQPGGATLPADLTFAEQLTVRGQDFLYTVEGGREIRRWSIDEAGQISGGSGQNSQLSAYHGGLVDMDGFALNGAGHLLALSGGEVQLGSYSPSRDGRLRMRDQVEQADGIGISQPSALEVAELAGRNYAIVAARGSSSLSVIEVAADGTLIPRDHLLDSTETRFGTAAHVAVAARGDQVFVAAAGSEPGLSLFQLLPGGRLLHLDTLADHAGITLADISALDMLARADGSLGIAVASETEAGVTWLDVATGPQGVMRLGSDVATDLAGTNRDDLLAGGAGAETLRGGNGDDVLMDGAGADRLSGGAGADVFVMAADGVMDIITDFNPAIDRLDLSNWTFLRSPSQLTVLPTGYGAELAFGEELLRLESTDGSSFDAALIRSLSLLDGDRLLPGWFQAFEEMVAADTGSDASETLTGSKARDVLTAGAGNDTILASGGDDMIDGGAGADVMNGGPGSDHYRVDDLDDQVVESRRWEGHDSVESSVDFWMGRAHIEDLELTGQADIRGIGNGLENVIRGNSGSNILDGGKNNDTLIGGDGDDIYHIRAPGDRAVEQAGGGIDTVKAFRAHALDAHVERLYLQTLRNAAGEGVAGVNGVGNGLDNTIVGNPFDNMIIGREGRDTLKGQGGADSFVFDRAIGPNNIDRIIDFTPGEDEIWIKAGLVGLGKGPLALGNFRQNSVALDGNDHLLYDRSSGVLRVDLDGKGGAAAHVIMTLDGTPDLTAADIFLV